MSSNLGHEYEKHIRANLKGIIHPSDKGLVGAAHEPDVIVKYKTKPVVIELKYMVSKADFGQIELHYDKKWTLAPSKNEAFRSALLFAGFEIFINKEWGEFGSPFWFLKKRGEDITTAQLEHDKKTFKDKFWDAPKNVINTYYRNKGVNYLQIKGMGLYRVGGSPQTINSQIPLFAPTIQIRARVKRSGDKNGRKYYSFNASVEAFKGGLAKSKYDLDKDHSFLLNIK